MYTLRSRRSSRGAILLVALLLLTLLATLGAGLLSSSLSENVVASNDVNSQRALGVAEAGIAHARRVIATELSTTSLTSRLLGATTSAPEVALAGLTNSAGLGANNGTYSVWVSNNTTAYLKSPGYPADLGGFATDTDSRIWVRSVGTYRNATRTVRALLDFSMLFGPPGAITLIDGSGSDSATFNGNSFEVSGNDTPAPTTSGACGNIGGAKRAVSVNSAGSLTAITNAVGAGQKDRFLGDGASASQGSYANDGTISAATLQAVVNALTPGAQTITPGTTSANFGTGDAPGVYLVPGSIHLAGSGRGYGILIVTGDFDMSGRYVWEGLVLVMGTGSARINATGAAGDEGKIYGSILAANTQGGATSLRISGNGGARYSGQAICRARKGMPSGTLIAWQQMG